MLTDVRTRQKGRHWKAKTDWLTQGQAETVGQQFLRTMWASVY